MLVGYNLSGGLFYSPTFDFSIQIGVQILFCIFIKAKTQSLILQMGHPNIAGLLQLFTCGIYRDPTDGDSVRQMLQGKKQVLGVLCIAGEYNSLPGIDLL